MVPRHHVLIALALGAGACADPEAIEPAPLEAVLVRDGSAVAVDPQRATITVLRGGEALARLDGAGLALGVVDALDDRVSYDPWPLVGQVEGGGFPPAGLAFLPAVGARIEEADAEQVVVSLRHAAGGVELTSRITLVLAGDGRFRATWVPDDASRVAYFRVGAEVSASEHFYGLGEQFDDVDQRGKRRAMQLEVDALESANNEAHVPVPFVVGTRGWGLFVQSSHPGAFDVAATSPERVEATFGTGLDSGDGLTFHLFVADHALDVTQRYYATTGYPRMPAPWALGPLLWRNENDDQAQVVSDMETMRDLDLAASGIWIDRPYATEVNTFDFEAARFPDPAAMVARAHALGFRMALWQAPYLDEEAEATAPLVALAESKGYYPDEVGILLNGWGRPIDFTNPEAVAWWQEQLRAYVDLGFEGFKLDYAEDVVPGVLGARNVFAFADGSDERTMHRGYTLAYHRTHAELLPEDGGFLLCRAGKWGDQIHGPIIWPGDLDATMWKHREVVERDGETIVAVGGLPASVVAGLTLGPSGFPFYGADTGGYRHAPPDVETFRRWFEQTAFSSVMQIGTATNDVAWEFADAELLDSYRFYTRLHLRLFPYLWTHALGVLTHGRPIQRPLGLAFPELAQHPNDVYLLGDALLVAPVVEPGVTSRDVPIPAGTWVDFWTGTVVEGPGVATTLAPLGTIPVYLRAGAPLPMLRPTIDTLAPVDQPLLIDSFASDPGPLWVRVAPGAEGSLRLYDGSFVGHAPTDAGLALTVEPGTTFAGDAMIELIAFGPSLPSALVVDGAPLSRVPARAEFDAASEGWFYDPDATGGTLWIKLQPGAHAVAVSR